MAAQPNNGGELDRLAESSQPSLWAELLDFLKHNKNGRELAARQSALTAQLSQAAQEQQSSGNGSTPRGGRNGCRTRPSKRSSSASVRSI